MLKKIALLVMMAAVAVPALAAAGINSQVKVDSSANALLLGWNGVGGTAGTSSVACRFYSVFGSDAGINNNTTACTGIRCLRPFNTNLNNFACNGENTVSYNGDAQDQSIYNLIDAQANAGACNHAAFYAFAGVLAKNDTPLYQGNAGIAGCTGTVATNCMDLADSADSRSAPLLNVNAGVQGPHDIASVGGLSPVPTVKVNYSATNGCAAGQAKLTWDEPEAYTNNMKGVASPLKGVRLWKSGASCGSCPSGDVAAGGWAPVALFPTGSGAAGSCQPITGDTWFALTVVAKGPSNVASTEIETGIVGGAGFVGANSQCVNTQATVTRIASMSARYTGRGSVNVKFSTGSEAGVTGFYVQRATSATGPWTRVSEMLAAKGDGSEYVSTEKVKAGLGNVVYYNVQVVMNDGSTVDSGSSAVTLPATQRKLNPGN